jgi:ribonuclease VapC
MIQQLADAVVVDTSAVLCVYFEEPLATWASTQLDRSGRLLMSTINLAECLIRFRDKRPVDADRLQAQLLATGIQFIAPDTAQAIIAARARLLFPFNLGDCFACALAKTESLPLLTLDQDFRAADLHVILPPTT